MASQPPDAGVATGGQPEEVRLPAPGRYHHRPTEVAAIQWTGSNLAEVREFVTSVDDGSSIGRDAYPGEPLPLWVVKSYAWHFMPVGAWILREPQVKGAYPCGAEKFTATYALAGQDASADPMFERAYMDVQAVLDRALGTQEDDGAGAGIAADVALLAYQRDTARTEAAQLAEQVHQLTDPGLFDLVPARATGEMAALASQRDEATAQAAWLANQLQEHADPETRLSDLEHRLGEATRMAESLAGSSDTTTRECGRKLLAVLGDDRIPAASMGVAMIRGERGRQVAVEGYTPEHDTEHPGGELARAGAAYALWAAGILRPAVNPYDALRWWPPDWKFGYDDDPARALVKAGALIAAEIDRIVAEEGGRG